PLALGLGRHFRIRHVTGHVIDQGALVAVPGDDGRLPGRTPLQEGIPGIDAEEAARLFTAVAGRTGTFQDRLDLSREIALRLTSRCSNRGRLSRDGGPARCRPDR